MWLLQPMRLSTLLSSVVLGSLVSATGLLIAQQGMAQSPATCEPPRGDEYLLLVVKQNAETEDQLQQLLPPNAAISTCNYLDDEVVRVGGFASSEIANAWAQYLTDMTGLQAFVARPSTSSSADAPAMVAEPVVDTTTSEAPPSGATASETAANFPSPTQVPASGETSSPAPDQPAQPADQQVDQQQVQTPPSGVAASTPSPEGTPAENGVAASSPTATNQAYSPQPLGSGYAVLVHYFNRPEVAADVNQVTSQPVGLVAYEQRPFLLAAYTTDASAAATILQSLSERGFTAVIVDSRRAILLSPAVMGTAGQS